MALQATTRGLTHDRLKRRKAKKLENHLAKLGASTHAPGFPEAGSIESCNHIEVVDGCIVIGFGLCWWDMPNGAEQAVIVEPVDPAVHGVVRWRLIDLARWLYDEFAVSLDVTIVVRELIPSCAEADSHLGFPNR